MSRLVPSARMRSPNTPFDAQFRVERGGGNSSGSTTMNTSAAAPASTAHQPIHTRLHAARAISGSTAKRTQTLHGLAWRIHCSPRRPNSPAMRPSGVDVVMARRVRARRETDQQADPRGSPGLSP